MSLSKKMTSKGTLRQVFYLSEGTSPHLFTQGKGGGGRRGELTREKVRGAKVNKAGRKYQHD